MKEGDYDGLTRAQRKRIKREAQKSQREEEREKAHKKNAIAKSVRYAVIALILFVLTYLIFFSKPDIAGMGILRISTPIHDFGAVSVKGGIVETEIPIVNIGEGDLTITALDSSCGCTTASVINNEEEGPIFQMAAHGRNPTNWNTRISPGATAKIKVYYDPAVHPDLRGPVTRVITVYSDDPLSPKQELRVKVTQID